MINLARILILLLVTTVVNAQEEGYSIEVNNLRIANDKGQMPMGLYDSEDSWLKKPVSGRLGIIVNGKSTVAFVNIPDGTYEISVFHNEDNDGQLDTILGILIEDTGTSNDAPTRFGPSK